MSCYHPLVGLWSGALTETGKKFLRIVNPLKGDFGSTDPIKLLEMYPGSVLIPCNHCIGCKLEYSRSWADRMMLELQDTGKAVFITLTYNKEHLVNADGDHESGRYGSLFKPHVQTFMKDLREDLRTNYNLFVRFYCCGEYGSFENTHRPHYHIILFGLSLSDLPNLREVGINELRQKVFSSPLIERHWPHGYISVGDVSWKSCAYVARYVNKKALHPDESQLNEMLHLNPEFSLMSRRPGIGKKYFDAHPDCLDYTKISLPSPDGSLNLRIPKYFVSLLELSDPEKYDKLVAERSVYAHDSMLAKLSQTDLPFLDYLSVEESNVLARIRSLKRCI